MINLNKSINFLLFISVILGILFRLYNINYNYLWFDEIATFWVTDPNISLTEMFQRNRTTEGAPYFYYIIIYYLHKIFGYDPNIGRYFSSFIGIENSWFKLELLISIFSTEYEKLRKQKANINILLLLKENLNVKCINII